MKYSLVVFSSEFIGKLIFLPKENSIYELHARNIEDIIWNKESDSIINQSIEMSFFINELINGNANAIRMLFARTDKIEKINRIGFTLFDKLKKISPIWGNHQTDFLLRAEKLKKSNLKDAILYLSDGIEWHKNGEINELRNENSIQISEDYYKNIKIDYGIAERNSIFSIESQNDRDIIPLVSKTLAETYQMLLKESISGLLTPEIQIQKIDKDEFNGYF